MKVLMLGEYDINTYSRGRVLYKGLKKTKTDVNIFLPKKNKNLRVFKRLMKKDFNVILATGKKILLLAWLLKPIHKKKIIFDVFISDYENLVIDRKIVNPNSIKSKLLWFGDKFSCNISDHNILDTQEHIQYFCKEFKLNKSKFTPIYVGSDEETFNPTSKKIKNEPFLVEFHGTFIPLQGIKFILNAAKILEKEKIEFKIIGKGQESKKIKKLADYLKLKNVKFTDSNLTLKNLAQEIQNADICLGIFGESIKAKNVIPNKVFETVACKKPLITSESPAMKEKFTDKVNCLLCRAADPEDLAEKILELKNNKGLREKLAQEGYSLFLKELSEKNIGKELMNLIKNQLSQ
jgi:glycosyltransferase involved in cell wall biosynthesis